MVSHEGSGAGAPCNPTMAGICGFEVAHCGAHADLDLHAVEVRVIDEGGAGFEALLGPDEALAVITRLSNALAELLGRSQRP